MKIPTLTLACLLCVLPITQAQANNDPEYLIQGCKEVVAIYAKRDEKRLAAKLTTSVSEALRAGYCRGMLDEYRRSYKCGTNDWLIQAQNIAELPLSFAKRTTVHELLGISCDV